MLSFWLSYQLDLLSCTEHSVTLAVLCIAGALRRLLPRAAAPAVPHEALVLPAQAPPRGRDEGCPEPARVPYRRRRSGLRECRGTLPSIWRSVLAWHARWDPLAFRCAADVSRRLPPFNEPLL